MSLFYSSPIAIFNYFFIYDSAGSSFVMNSNNISFKCHLILLLYVSLSCLAFVRCGEPVEVFSFMLFIWSCVHSEFLLMSAPRIDGLCYTFYYVWWNLMLYFFLSGYPSTHHTWNNKCWKDHSLSLTICLSLFCEYTCVKLHFTGLF